MPQEIDVDDEVFAALQERAIPLVDTPNSVIRRVLGLSEMPTDVGRMRKQQMRGWASDAESNVPSKARTIARKRTSGGKGRPRRAPKGVLLPETEYELPILQTLVELGGHAPTSKLLDSLETKLDGRLQAMDRDRLASGDVRWKNRAQFVRLKLVRGGDMVKDSPRGIWEISDRGRQRISETA